MTRIEYRGFTAYRQKGRTRYQRTIEQGVLYGCDQWDVLDEHDRVVTTFAVERGAPVNEGVELLQDFTHRILDDGPIARVK